MERVTIASNGATGRVGRARAAGVCLLLVTVLPACVTTIPDLRPFADKTVEMRTASVAAFRVPSEIALELQSEATDPAHITTLEQAIEGFGRVAEVRMRALGAVVDYTDRLALIAAAGRSEEETIAGVRENVKTLIGVAGDIAKSAPAAGLAVEGGKLLADLISEVATAFARARTARTLDEAISQADEYVGRLTGILAQDFEALRGGLANMNDVLAQSIEARDGFKQTSSLRDLLMSERGRLAQKAHDSKAAAGDITAFLSNEETLKKVGAPVQATVARRAAALARVAASQAVVRDAGECLVAWRSAHGDLRSAMKESRRVSLASLTAAVEALKANYDRIEKLRTDYLMGGN